MGKFLKQSICCILGAGYSHVAGAPLTRDLFATRTVAVPSETAARRYHAVWNDYEAWLSENPCRNPEEYLADLPKHGQSAAWTANERYMLSHRDLKATVAIEGRASTLPFPALIFPYRRALFHRLSGLWNCWQPSSQLRSPLTQRLPISAMERVLHSRSIVNRILPFGGR